jgi:orotate phosphoribosyltransferase
MDTLQGLIGLKPRYFNGASIATEEILSWFSLCEAYWKHSGNPRDPHAELTTGKCSNGFFDCLRVLEYVNLSEILADQLALKIRSIIGDQRIDWVIDSPMAGITFGHDVARALGATRNFFTEKDPADKDRMLWSRRIIPAGETVLQIEELITTSKTTNAVQRAVDFENKEPVNWLPFIGALVHRPDHLPLSHYGNRLVIPLIEKEVWAVDQKDCPLCAAGSRRYKPKQDKNWQILTGKIKS